MQRFHTPISRTKSSALMRVLDYVPRGYTRFILGTVAADKLPALLKKFHLRFGIAATPSQRITRKQNKLANAVLAVYAPEGAETVDWVVLFTDGELEVNEKLQEVMGKVRLQWIGYELTRYADKGKTKWTWKRPSQRMQEHYTMLNAHLRRRCWERVAEELERLAMQPGFHGVREQSKRLFAHAKQAGYPDTFPKLFYLQKISHGEPAEIVIEDDKEFARKGKRAN